MSKKIKRITILYDFLKELGGLERVMFFQANKLAKKYKVELIFSYVSDKDKEIICNELGLNKNIPLKQITPMKNELLQFAINFISPSRLRSIKTDLIISHSFMSTQLAYSKKKIDKTPYIVFMHHPPNFLYSNIHGWVNNPARFSAMLLGKIINKYLKKKDIEAVKNADLVLANSKYTAKRIKKIYNLDAKVIYPNISNFFIRMSNNKIKKFLAKKKIVKLFILAHGRIIPDKNYKSILPLIKKLDENLIISGSISKKYKKEMEEEIKKQGIQNKIKILGKISKEDLLGYYNSASLFLMPAQKEDFGLTVVEAIACGCPVVAWNDGAGPSEIIIEKINGFLAKPYDFKDFEDKIKKVLEMKWDKQKISKSVKKFSENNIEKEILKKI